MEPEGSLPHSQVPTTCPYPKPARSSPYPTSHFLNIHLNIIFPPTPGSSKWSLPLRFPQEKLVCPFLPPIRATCPDTPILFDLITQIMFGEEYGSSSFLLYSFLHSPITSSLLVQNIHPSILFRTPSAYVLPSIWATKFHSHRKEESKL